MIQAMVKKLNGKRLRQRISSAILIVAILVSFLVFLEELPC